MSSSLEFTLFLIFISIFFIFCSIHLCLGRSILYESLGLRKYTKPRLLVEAANLNQLTDWYEKTVIPKTYAKFAQEYLQEPTIQTSLQNIANAEKLPDANRKTEQGKEFIKGELRRKRFLCEEVSSKKKYLIHTLAEVIPIFEY